MSSKSNKLLFGCSYPPLQKSGKFSDSPKHFQFTLDWYGVDESMVRFCRVPMQVERLEVAVQAEQLVSTTRPTPPPSVTEEYLDMLDENILRNKFEPYDNSFVFVSRSLMHAHRGGHAGAKYLDQVLMSMGLTVYYPERHHLGHQIKTYAGAKEIIFSEGSAIHGVQLLGRGLHSLSILNRRTDTKLAEQNLLPRCTQFSFIKALGGVIN